MWSKQGKHASELQVSMVYTGLKRRKEGRVCGLEKSMDDIDGFGIDVQDNFEASRGCGEVIGEPDSVTIGPRLLAWSNFGLASRGLESWTRIA